MQFTKRDLRAMHLASEFAKNSLELQLTEYHKLIDTLIYLNETLREAKVQIQDWQAYSETLLIKFCFHGLTIHNILSGLILQSDYYNEELSGKKIMDKASAKVVLRSQLEAFLMYHHIYLNPKADEEKQLRYFAWVYSALLQRQDFPTRTAYGAKRKEEDKLEIDKIIAKIKSLKSFSQLTPNQQKALIDGGSGKLFTHWSKILNESGFGQNHTFTVLYNYWSVYSHSEGLSAIQIHGSGLSYNNNDRDAIADLHASKLLVCIWIRALVNQYKIVEMKFNTLPEDLQIDIELYEKQSRMAKM